MENNDAWVEDVRRWYFNGTRGNSAATAAPPRRAKEPEPAVLGYEAAHPALQSQDWTTPATSGFGTLS